MPGKRKSLNSPLADQRLADTPALELALMLETQRALFEQDRKNPLPAFEGLALIAAALWSDGDTQRQQDPVVPSWIVETLAEGWMRYREAQRSGTSRTLGEAFQLEGRGQGNRRKIVDADEQLRDIRIAIGIARGADAGIKIEALIAQYAADTNLSIGQVKRIWSRNAERARGVVKRVLGA